MDLPVAATGSESVVERAPESAAESSRGCPALYTSLCQRLRRIFAGDHGILPDFPHDFVKQLLMHPNAGLQDATTQAYDSGGASNDEGISDFDSIDMDKGVPNRPYFCHLAKAIYVHITRLEPLTRYAPVENLHDRTLSPSAILDTDRETMIELRKIQDIGPDGDILLVKYLSKIQPGGILLLLGMQRTRKSLELLPPDRMMLTETFQARHCPKEILSVGARALSKHNHRSSEGFWGVAKGSQASQNAHAHKILCNILDNAVWMNIHLLPGDVGVYEIRIKEGYGARWSADGSVFRGFLEPQIDQGWAVGWRH